MNSSSSHTLESHMLLCLKEAYKAKELVSPNPMVGTLLELNGETLAISCHEEHGKAHAEQVLLKKLSNKNLSDTTLYVTLEPCTHEGKTPACAKLIAEAKIPKVIIAAKDTNQTVSGDGISFLQEQGIEIISGVLEDEARYLNRRFFTFHEKKRPYIILKWAETKDGFMAKKDGSSKWISCEESRTLVHTWRAREDSILVGTNTALVDNPMLNARDVPCKKQPLRIFLDKNGKVPVEHSLLDNNTDTLCITEENRAPSASTKYLQTSFNQDLWPKIFSYLHANSIQSIIIEGGAKTLQTLIKRELWDEARIFTATHSFGDGLESPKIESSKEIEMNSGSDLLRVIFNNTFNISDKTHSLFL